MGSISNRPAAGARAGNVVQGPAAGLGAGHTNTGSRAAIAGPGGGGIAGVRGPNGGGALVARGPNGGVGGVVRGPGGGAIAGARGPYGNGAAIARLPDGYNNTNWNGDNYYYRGGSWYSPYWHDDEIWYAPTYPPVGWYAPATNYPNMETTVVNNNTYYVSEGVYYQKTTQDGKEGYAVVKAPAQVNATTNTALPDPFDVMKKGFAYLSAQPQFSMNVSDTYDEITSSGQKVSYVTRREMTVRRPGSVAINFEGQGEKRQAILDKGKLTLIDRTKNSYGEATLPDTINGALDKLASEYGVTVAAAELLRSDLYDHVVSGIRTGQYLGKETVGVYECDHLGFTMASADWEIWFQTGERPLVRKFSVSHKNVPSRPRYTLTVAKFEPTTVTDSAFQVVIPAGAKQIPLAPKPADKEADKD